MAPPPGWKPTVDTVHGVPVWRWLESVNLVYVATRDLDQLRYLGYSLLRYDEGLDLEKCSGEYPERVAALFADGLRRSDDRVGDLIAAVLAEVDTTALRNVIDSVLSARARLRDRVAAARLGMEQAHRDGDYHRAAMRDGQTRANAAAAHALDTAITTALGLTELHAAITLDSPDP